MRLSCEVLGGKEFNTGNRQILPPGGIEVPCLQSPKQLSGLSLHLVGIITGQNYLPEQLGLVSQVLGVGGEWMLERCLGLLKLSTKGRSSLLLVNIPWDQMSPTSVHSPDSINSRLYFLLQEARHFPIRVRALPFIAVALTFRNLRFFVQFATLWPELSTTPRLSGSRNSFCENCCSAS